jgi:hypothetical protein
MLSISTNKMKILLPYLLHCIDDISIYLFLKIKYRLFILNYTVNIVLLIPIPCICFDDIDYYSNLILMH